MERCSKCAGPRDRPGQRYCRACHNAHARATRARYSTLSDEQRRCAKARAYANVYRRRGLLVDPGACQVCGDTDPGRHMHHADYSRPLDVTWLCPPCHRATHRALRDGTVTPTPRLPSATLPEMPNDARLAYRLTRAAERERQVAGLSDAELAAAAKVSETTIRNARHRQVGLIPARRIVTALGATDMRDAHARGWVVPIEKGYEDE